MLLDAGSSTARTSPCYFWRGRENLQHLNQIPSPQRTRGKRDNGRCQEIEGNKFCLKQKHVLHPDLGISAMAGSRPADHQSPSGAWGCRRADGKTQSTGGFNARDTDPIAPMDIGPPGAGWAAGWQAGAGRVSLALLPPTRLISLQLVSPTSPKGRPGSHGGEERRSSSPNGSGAATIYF